MVEVARLIGVDMSADPAKSAACVLTVDAEGVVDVELVPEPSDELIASWLTDACPAVVGIDAPFGWPMPFVRAVSSWSADPAASDWPRWTAGTTPAADGWRAEKDLLSFRITDRFVRKLLKERHSPGCKLSKAHWPNGFAVAADKIAVTAFRVAGTLARAEIGDRTGLGRAIEVYPGAALAEWCLNAKGYKKDRSVREERVLRPLREHLEVPFARVPSAGRTALWQGCAATDHNLDALVAAVTAYAAVTGATYPPPSSWEELRSSSESPVVDELATRRVLGTDESIEDIVRAEGWIHHPTKSVSEIFRATDAYERVRTRR
jgi:hypothetical protein